MVATWTHGINLMDVGEAGLGFVGTVAVSNYIQNTLKTTASPYAMWYRLLSNFGSSALLGLAASKVVKNERLARNMIFGGLLYTTLTLIQDLLVKFGITSPVPGTKISGVEYYANDDDLRSAIEAEIDSQMASLDGTDDYMDPKMLESAETLSEYISPSDVSSAKEMSAEMEIYGNDEF